MIIFLHGDDNYRLNQSRDEIIKKYQAKYGSGFNFFRIDGVSASAVADVSEAIKSVSLFKEVKLILINNIFNDAQTAKDLYELFAKYKTITDKEIVILATHFGAINQAKQKELLALLSDSKNLVRNFTNLEGGQLQTWLKKEAMNRGISFAPGVLARFMAIGGVDSWARIHNLDKLANYLSGRPSADGQVLKDQIVTGDIIDLLIKTETEPNVFEFIDALGSGRRAQAFSLLSGELAFGRDPYYLLSMVMYQFRNMLMVKDLVDRNFSSSQIAQKSGIHPFVVKKMVSAVSRFSLADIRRLYQEIIDLEQGAKQGKRDLGDGLFSLALG